MTKDKIDLAKIIGTLSAVPLFIFWMYRFGPWPGGYRVQRLATEAHCEGLLKMYVDDQEMYQRHHGFFDGTLHSRLAIYQEEKFRLAFANESPEVAKVCPDCIFEKTHLRIGVIGRFHDEETIWTIDNNRNLVNVKPF